MVKILIEYPEIVDHTARMPFQCLGGAVHEVVGDHGGEKACAVLCKAGGSPASGREQGRNCAEQTGQEYGQGRVKAQAPRIEAEDPVAQHNEPLAEGRLQIPIVRFVLPCGDHGLPVPEHFVGTDTVVRFMNKIPPKRITGSSAAEPPVPAV